MVSPLLWLFGIQCRLCGDRIRWPALDTQAHAGMCPECRWMIYEWLAEMGYVLTTNDGGP